MSRGQAEGFSFEVIGRDVVIFHHGRRAVVLRGDRAEKFLDSVTGDGKDNDPDDQQLMARVTGNYRRGNERQARNHPRNQGRR
jgi:hypothetical protein